MEMLIFALVLLGVLVLIMFLQYVNAKRADGLYLQLLNNNFGLRDRSSYDGNRLRGARDYHDRHQADDSLDDVTWSDLSLDEIFADADRTESDAGCQMLYYMLRNPLSDPDEISNRRELINFWRRESKIRNDVLIYLHHAGRLPRGSVYDLLKSCREIEPKSFTEYYVRIALLAVSVASMFVSTGLGTVFFVAVLLSNVYAYYRDRTRILPHLRLFAYICSLMQSADDVSRLISSADNASLKQLADRMKALLDDLHDVRRGSLAAIGSERNTNPFRAVMNVLGIFVFADQFRFWKLRDKLMSRESDVDRLISLTGSVDALISAAGYVESFGDALCIPKFDDNPAGEIRLKGVYHPLIENPVANDLDAGGSILLTGANASGKSTFLRSVALAGLFAETFGYACAAECSMPLIRIISAMSISDDVSGGDSYYMAEIKAVRRMMNVRDRDRNNGNDMLCACFIDELLNGTNTEERIAACTQILEAMAKDGMRVFAATHDMELTGLLSDAYVNYHFEEDLSEGDVRFSYLLKAGPSQSSNAIRLLIELGFDDGITDRAFEMIRRHKRDGVWSAS